MKKGIYLGIFIFFLNINVIAAQIMPPEEVLQDIQTERIFTNVFFLLMALVLVFGLKKTFK